MKFLVFGGGGIGDTIFELALVKALKNKYHGCQVDLLCSVSPNMEHAIGELLECQSYTDNCWMYSKKKILKFIKTILMLKLKKYDYAFSCTTRFKKNNKIAAVAKLIGTKLIEKDYGDRKINSIKVNVDENIHFIEQYQRLAQLLDASIRLDSLVINKDKLEGIEKVDSKNREIITICLGTNVTIYSDKGKCIEKNIKEWSIERWVKLSKRLVDKGYFVVMIGGKKEAQQMKLFSLRSSYINNLAGKTSIIESLSIIEQSKLIVGADTGMMHCAAALGKQTLSLFGGTDANVWRPYSNIGYVINGKCDCAPCYGKQYAINCTHRKCMDAISVEMVEDVIKEIM